MQTKTTMRYHLTAIRMVIIKISTTINAGEGVKKRETSYIIGGNVNSYCHYKNSMEVPLKKTKKKKKKKEKTYHMTQQSHAGHISGENHNSRRHMYCNVHCSAVYNS